MRKNAPQNVVFNSPKAAWEPLKSVSGSVIENKNYWRVGIKKAGQAHAEVDTINSVKISLCYQKLQLCNLEPLVAISEPTLFSLVAKQNSKCRYWNR
jgi:hypothetical protein